MPPRPSQEKGTPRITANRIPKEALEDAKAGTISALTLLFSSLTPQNYTQEVIDVILHNLNPSLMRPCPPDPAQIEGIDERTREKMLKEFETYGVDVVKARYCTTEAWSLVLKRCPKTALPGVVQQLLPHFDTILDWCFYFLVNPVPRTPGEAWTLDIRFGDPGHPCGILFFVMKGYPEIKQWLLTSEKALSYAIQAWVATDAEGAYTSFRFCNHECPQAQYLRTFLSLDVPDARQRIFDLLTPRFGSRESTTLFRSVIDAAVDRCTRIIQVTRATVEAELVSVATLKVTAIGAIFTYLNEVLQAVRHLGQDPTISLAFIKSEFSGKFTEALKIWLLNETERGKDRETRQRAFTIMAGLVAFLTAESRRSAAHWRAVPHAFESVIKAGYLEVLVEGLSEHKIRSQGGAMSEKSMEMVKQCCGRFPSMSRVLYPKIFELRGRQFNDGSFLDSTGHAERWYEFSMDALCAHYSDFETPPLCDHIYCPRDRRTFTPSKACSSCHSLTYCSVECQKADWDALHRNECQAARAVHEQAMIHGRPRYTQYRRAFHADFIARKADTATRDLDSAEKDMPPEQKLSVTPQVIHLKLWGHLIQSLDNYIRSTEATFRKGSDIHYLNDRLLALARSYPVEEAREGLRMVLGELSFHDQTVQVLAKVKKAPGDAGKPRFMVQSCVMKLRNDSLSDKLPSTAKEILQRQVEICGLVVMRWHSSLSWETCALVGAFSHFEGGQSVRLGGRPDETLSSCLVEAHGYGRQDPLHIYTPLLQHPLRFVSFPPPPSPFRHRLLSSLLRIGEFVLRLTGVRSLTEWRTPLERRNRNDIWLAALRLAPLYPALGEQPKRIGENGRDEGWRRVGRKQDKV
ncbi:hypothetical protein NMY22_g13364 [Coprinellus aureogranulatus]|nr:hypothetical protein NMY22_g13364 [Coprinellus aureogranulatus]